MSNSVTPALWQSIEKDLPIDASGPEIFSMLIMKQQFLNTSTARKMVNDLSDMSLIKEPGQDADKFGNKISELSIKIEGSGSSSPDLTVLVARSFLNCTVG